MSEETEIAAAFCQEVLGWGGEMFYFPDRLVFCKGGGQKALRFTDRCAVEDAAWGWAREKKYTVALCYVGEHRGNFFLAYVDNGTSRIYSKLSDNPRIALLHACVTAARKYKASRYSVA